MPYELILTETPAAGVGLIRLNRPSALNALNGPMVAELLDALAAFDADDAIGCIVVTGSDKAFAAGADIKQFAELDAVAMMSGGNFIDLAPISTLSKPIIAAVSGWALGGGSELALACDMIVASETARFGQPEVTLGIMAGAGATQRLTRTVGKALAMEILLGNRQLKADEALAAGLVNHVYPVESYLNEALALAGRIATMPRIATRMTKDAINKAFEMSLSDALDYEKRNFYLLFATEDKAEGIRAFIEKRPAKWTNR